MRPLLAIITLASLTLPLAALAARTSARPAHKTTAPPAAAYLRQVRPFMAKHCFACHNTKSNTADVNLEAFGSLAAMLKDHHTWEKVVQKLRTGEMPPKGSPRPDPAQVKRVTAWIEGEFERVERQAKPDPGRVTARRLNRAEYNNTVRDLLGVDFNPAGDFPQDDSGYGFDNIGDVLSVSPVLMEKYLTAAEKIARTALFGPETLKPTVVQIRTPGRGIQGSTKIPAEYDETGLTLLNSFHAVHRFPVEGEYAVRVVLTGERPAASEALQVGLWVDGKLLRQQEYDPEGKASFAVDRQDLAGQSTEIRARFPAGEHWVSATLMRMYEGLPASYSGPNPSKRQPPPRPDFSRFFPPPPPNLTPEELADFKRRQEERRARFRQRVREEPPVNLAKVNFIEIQGPYEQSRGASPASLRKVFTCGHLSGGHAPGCARKIVASLARRAFRRPVAPAEVDRLTKLVALAQRDGDSFEEGVCLAIQGLLVSPHFLFRIERDPPAAPPGGAYPISQHALASRLSYFLWSSMPDEALLSAADRGLLRKPEVVAAQVRRMLKDPRSRALVENFGGQWLELRKLESARPDPERFPVFEDYLRLSIRRETELFFQHIVQQDRSILDFIDGDYTFLNQRLAEFYGIPGVRGTEFRKVDLKGTPRAGVLTQASVLTVSSYATRTSPVLRGKWILENILNTPPPPPPPDVPTLDEAKVGQSGSLRIQLEEHRKNPSCASCHARLDPLGFGLENFDAIGRWRGEDGKFPIDASASLPDGREFKGADGLRAILKQDRDAFTQCLTEKLLTYALGRGLERYDNRTVKSIAGRVAAQDYRFSALALEIVNSLPFRLRRGEGAR